MSNEMEEHTMFSGLIIWRSAVRMVWNGVIKVEEAYLMALIESYTDSKSKTCSASNSFLANEMGIKSRQTVSRMITRLEKLGFLQVVIMNHNTRVMRVKWPDDPPYRGSTDDQE